MKIATHEHLRLVQKAEVKCDRVKTNYDDKQLSFFYPSPHTVILLDVTNVNHHKFTSIIDHYMPRWIIDVRPVPRLDRIAISRNLAFTIFEKKKSEYVDLFGRLGIESYGSADSNPLFWAPAVKDILKASSRPGPYIFLFDNDKLMSVADNILPNVMKAAVGSMPEFCRLA